MKCCITFRLIATENWDCCCPPFGMISSRFIFFLQILSPQTGRFHKGQTVFLPYKSILFASPPLVSRQNEGRGLRTVDICPHKLLDYLHVRVLKSDFNCNFEPALLSPDLCKTSHLRLVSQEGWAHLAAGRECKHPCVTAAALWLGRRREGTLAVCPSVFSFCLSPSP